MMTDLETLQKRIRIFVDDRDWDQFHNPKDLALSLILEAAEVVEHFQWKSDVEMDEHIAMNRSEVGNELADVLYWVLLLANKAGIDLSESFEKKMQKNEAKYPIEKSKGNHKKYTELDS